MTRHEGFFQQRQPAAVLKHALLREYTKVFASTVGSQDRARPVWVIDGYAGAGAYEEPDPEGTHPDGSPLIVLKMAEGFQSKELSALLATDRVIPVVHGISYEDLRDESPLLASRSGLSTGEDTLEQVAVKIANAVRPEQG
ncbi:hypothetical protein [Propioniciclava coleopterorum]|uniref:hypothetical protein n=1 Tax=Propioniciclava coleopterorum TaxID=2714937 RepID=UPI00197D3AC8|nr:hypothetical protein [Propioniciclava coleopterorum]